MSDLATRALVVDDDQLVRRLCAETLHRRGHEVVTAGTGQEARQYLAQGGFSLLVLDLVLPDASGIEILQAARQLDPDIVVLLVTGYASLDSAIDALRLGAYEYLRKPFTTEELVRVAERGLEQRRLAVRNRELLEQLDQVNRDLTERVKLATDELGTFSQLGQEFGDTTAPAAMVQHLLRAACQICGAAAGALVAASGDEVALAEVEGPRGMQLQPVDFADEPLVRQALETTEFVIAPYLLDDSAAATGPLALAGFSSALIVPLPGARPAPGALLLLDAESEFTAHHAHLVEVMAAQAALILPRLPNGLSPALPAPESGAFVDLHDLLGPGG